MQTRMSEGLSGHAGGEMQSQWQGQSKIIFLLSFSRKKIELLGPNKSLWGKCNLTDLKNNQKKAFWNGKCQVMLIIIRATVWLMRFGEFPTKLFFLGLFPSPAHTVGLYAGSCCGLIFSPSCPNFSSAEAEMKTWWYLCRIEASPFLLSAHFVSSFWGTNE